MTCNFCFQNLRYFPWHISIYIEEKLSIVFFLFACSPFIFVSNNISFPTNRNKYFDNPAHWFIYILGFMFCFILNWIYNDLHPHRYLYCWNIFSVLFLKKFETSNTKLIWTVAALNKCIVRRGKSSSRNHMRRKWMVYSDFHFVIPSLLTNSAIFLKGYGTIKYFDLLMIFINSHLPLICKSMTIVWVFRQVNTKQNMLHIALKRFWDYGYRKFVD